MNQTFSHQGAAMPDRVVVINGVPHLYFSGTAYLCMNHNAAFTRLLEEGMQLYGTNYGSSRSGNFTLPVYEQTEKALAERLHAEATLTISSGFMAAQLVIRFYEGTGTFMYAPDSHPALLRTKQDYYTGSFENWATQLPEKIAAVADDRIILVCNSIDPLKAAYHDFSWIDQLPGNKSILLIVDDSHGLGITGKNGEGIYAGIKDRAPIDSIVVSSLGKAMGIPGGIILSNRHTINQLRTSPYFTAASPIAPAYLYACLQGEAIYEQERKQLRENIIYFQGGLQQVSGFRHIENYPVIYCMRNELAGFLLEQNILISSFAYPTPADGIITRIVLNSHHRKEDMDTLLRFLKDQ
ncbi:aminotransferase class I/II-fold pyridoxal phosphate-dependent enzyme [Flavihumibacter sp. CACIAM 22H1]|uniref:aminotransferase class I/II-fold pyridoxal phosphate-dependent enzyme n=1 Tax=Flavihumibacter sp. CACIAM 22H1 TaxID=1812911 RepID=UPI000A425E2A|nr:aminotransferase class I/II-fold pyridoxal phosphate-dependent enzyme [Flavihumibacter sp. CACIAM 22H1]